MYRTRGKSSCCEQDPQPIPQNVSRSVGGGGSGGSGGGGISNVSFLTLSSLNTTVITASSATFQNINSYAMDIVQLSGYALQGALDGNLQHAKNLFIDDSWLSNCTMTGSVINNTLIGTTLAVGATFLDLITYGIHEWRGPQYTSTYSNLDGHLAVANSMKIGSLFVSNPTQLASAPLLAAAGVPSTVTSSYAHTDTTLLGTTNTLALEAPAISVHAAATDLRLAAHRTWTAEGDSVVIGSTAATSLSAGTALTLQGAQSASLSSSGPVHLTSGQTMTLAAANEVMVQPLLHVHTDLQVDQSSRLGTLCIIDPATLATTAPPGLPTSITAPYVGQAVSLIGATNTIALHTTNQLRLSSGSDRLDHVAGSWTLSGMHDIHWTTPGGLNVDTGFVRVGSLFAMDHTVAPHVAVPTSLSTLATTTTPCMVLGSTATLQLHSDRQLSLTSHQDLVAESTQGALKLRGALGVDLPTITVSRWYPYNDTLEDSGVWTSGVHRYAASELGVTGTPMFGWQREPDAMLTTTLHVEITEDMRMETTRGYELNAVYACFDIVDGEWSGPIDLSIHLVNRQTGVCSARKLSYTGRTSSSGWPTGHYYARATLTTPLPTSAWTMSTTASLQASLRSESPTASIILYGFQVEWSRKGW